MFRLCLRFLAGNPSNASNSAWRTRLITALPAQGRWWGPGTDGSRASITSWKQKTSKHPPSKLGDLLGKSKCIIIKQWIGIWWQYLRHTWGKRQRSPWWEFHWPLGHSELILLFLGRKTIIPISWTRKLVILSIGMESNVVQSPLCFTHQIGDQKKTE